jgi:Arc/MetJ family transcription regulator
VDNANGAYTSVRTNIVIDDKLMREALRASGASTKKEAVERGLRMLIRPNKQAEIRKFRGKLR